MSGSDPMPAQVRVTSLGELIDRGTPAEPDPSTRRRPDVGVYRGEAGARWPLLTSLDRFGGVRPPHTKAGLEEHLLRNFLRSSRPYLYTAATNAWERPVPFLVVRIALTPAVCIGAHAPDGAVVRDGGTARRVLADVRLLQRFDLLGRGSDRLRLSIPLVIFTHHQPPRTLMVGRARVMRRVPRGSGRTTQMARGDRTPTG